MNRRPFFTIHDPAFREYCKKDQALPRAILGVTNPYFSNALAHWPNLIKLYDPAPKHHVCVRAHPLWS